MKILHVEKNSPAATLGFRPDDELIEINGHPIRDELDFQFYAADEPLRMLFKRGERIFVRTRRQGWPGAFGTTFQEMKYRHCGNHCVFCFVDQNPAGLRRTLYFKDEDFRLSFMYGNYVTLTNTTQRDLNRIIEQRLSPIYISVHAVDEEVRRRLLGVRREDRLLEKIRFLADHHIEMHAQIVLCPGYNDGPVLQDTIQRLGEYFPALQSVAVVPLGLTKHRRGLPALHAVSKKAAIRTLKLVDNLAIGFKQKFERYWVYAADEFYLRAQCEIPGKERYDDFSQIENGVGMCRDFMQTINKQKRYFPKAVSPRKITIVTGRSAGPFLERQFMPIFHSVQGLEAQLYVIANNFLGRQVTVSGLLAGQDIARQLRKKPLGALLLLPPNCLNSDGLFLDDWTPGQLEQSLGVRVYQPHVPLDIFKAL